MTNANALPTALFLCTGNSCRSQMAEGWAKHFWPHDFRVYSAGTEPHGMNARAIIVMAESGIDISTHHSKHLDELKDIRFDYVITVCDHANETCPVFSGVTTRLHVSFDDPPKLAKDATTEAEALLHYRRVRDEIRDFVQELPHRLAVASAQQ